ncbi:MAG: Rv1733c family protein [Streptosporangiaceae bacterium]
MEFWPLPYPPGPGRRHRAGPARRDRALRRRTDRIESALLTGLIALFLLAGPFAGIMTGRWADHVALRQMRADRSLHQVRATLLERGPQRLETARAGWTALSAPVRWTSAGRVHSGWVPVIFGIQPSQTLRIWVNGAGSPAGPPMGRANLQLRVALTIAGSTLGLMIALSAIGLSGHWLLDRRRLAEWDRAWAAVEPTWSSRI